MINVILWRLRCIIVDAIPFPTSLLQKQQNITFLLAYRLIALNAKQRRIKSQGHCNAPSAAKVIICHYAIGTRDETILTMRFSQARDCQCPRSIYVTSLGLLPSKCLAPPTVASATSGDLILVFVYAVSFRHADCRDVRPAIRVRVAYRSDN